MDHRAGTTLLRQAAQAVAVWATLTLLASCAQAQGPQFDVGSPPGAAGGSSLVGEAVGAAGGSSKVGQPIGAAAFPDFGTISNAPFSGRSGPQGSHIPASALATPGVPVFRITGAQATITQNTQPLQVPQVGDLELTADFVDYPIGGGPPGNMNLDAAINQLVTQNLDLLAAKLEVPMAEADVLTANLRANPIFYADTQLIPYGHFSFLRPGGPPQSDININYPLDITFKRLARTRSAREAKSTVEAQLQDAVRNQIDNLYTFYEGVVATGLTLNFSEKYVEGIRKVLAVTEQLYRDGQIQESDLLAVKTNVYKAELQVKESRVAKIKANRALALMLNLPLDDVDRLDVRDPVGKLQLLPMSRDDLVKKAIAVRPDLLAYKYGLRRAHADLTLAKANGYPDVFVLYQPYTLQNNTYLGVPSAYSWTLGVTATIPLYSRNQGNVTRAKINITQTEIQLASAERVVINDVLNAAQELEQSLVAVTEFQKQILPDSKKVRDAAWRRFIGGGTSALEYLAAQQDYNDFVRAYRDALVRHRAAILDLNTAVGERVLP
jgi:cobalt-zinc-cadmium efflux system outer membrane protein